MEFGAFELLITLLLLLSSLYYFSKVQLNYWKKRGVPGPTPVPIFGNFAPIFLQQKSLTEHSEEMYEKWKEYPFIGIFKGHSPAIVLHDLELIKHVLIKDFAVFPTRGVTYNGKREPISGHLFAIDEKGWRYLRPKLSPIFTSGKLRKMLELIGECADVFEDYLKKLIGDGKTVEFADIANKYTTDVIGTCAFGISMNALTSEESDFDRIGRRVFEPSYYTVFARTLRDASPGLFKLLNLRTFPKETSEYFTSSIKDTIEIREREGIVRHDLVDLLMEIKRNCNHEEYELTDGILAAQAFVFFAAGFGTSSITIALALHELAHAQEIQDKVREEIVKVLELNEGRISYEIMKEMTYFDMVFRETLRKHPVITVLERSAAQDYKLPGTNVTVKKGTKVFIPNYCLQRDPKYFPNPEVFDPERFTEEAKRQRHPMTYLPFGDGPRNCIGSRFAAFQVKIALIKVLKNYRIKPSALSPMPYKIDKKVFVLAPENGIHLEFQPLKYTDL